MVWIPLADDDPMPGNPDGLSQLVIVLRGEATDIRQAISSLSTVNTAEFWEGDAARGFAEARGRAVPDLELVADRIDTSANALAGFVPAMGDCQSRGRLAVSRARDAEATILKANMGLEDAARQAAADQAAADAFAQANPGVAPPPPPTYWGPNWNGIIEEAEGERAAAARLFHQAVEDYDVAASRCAAALHPAIADALRNPQHHGLLGGIVHRAEQAGHAALHAAEEVGERVVQAAEAAASPYLEIAGWAVSNLDLVSEGLGIAATVTAFIPGGQGVSLAISGVKLGLDVGLVLASDKKDWGAVYGDIAGFALFGAGRLATGISRARIPSGALSTAGSKIAEAEGLAARAVEGERMAQNTARIQELGQQVRNAREIAQEFAQDAARPAWRQSFEMIQHFGTDLPDQTALSLSRSAARWATAAECTEVAGHAMEGMDLSEVAGKHLLPERHETG